MYGAVVLFAMPFGLGLSGCAKQLLLSAEIASATSPATSPATSTQDTVILGVCNAAGIPFGGGSGTSESPYLICSVTQLGNVGSHLSNYFNLQANLDLKNASLTPIGSLGSPFTGTFNGNGYTLSNWNYSASISDYIGLFARTNGATIENLTLSSFTVTATGSTMGAGALVGSAKGTTLSKCSVTGSTISGNAEIGGLVGLIRNSTITNSAAIQVSVIGTQSGTQNSSATLGGLVGLLNSSTINHSYSTGVVRTANAGSDLGGLVGYSQAGVTISESYSTCTVSGQLNGSSMFVGGLVGCVFGGAPNAISNSYATGTITGGEGVGGLVGTGDLTFTNDYFGGTVNALSLSGGILGVDLSGTAQTGTYWDDTHGPATTSGSSGTGVSTSWLQSGSNLTGAGWSTSIWSFPVGAYPTLQ